MSREFTQRCGWIVDGELTRFRALRQTGKSVVVVVLCTPEDVLWRLVSESTPKRVLLNSPILVKLVYFVHIARLVRLNCCPSKLVVDHGLIVDSVVVGVRVVDCDVF